MAQGTLPDGTEHITYMHLALRIYSGQQQSKNQKYEGKRHEKKNL